MRDGPRGFRQDFTCPALLRWPSSHMYFTSTGLSPAMVELSRTFPFCTYDSLRTPTTPTLPQQNRFRLYPFRSPLLWISIFLSLPTGTKMFQFPAFAPTIGRRLDFIQPGCPIRRFTDQFLFADPRNFSQLTTSFFASGSLGIHRSLL